MVAPHPTRAQPDPSPPPDSVCVQANCEQLFSTSGNLSDPNMDVEFLAILTSIIKNKAAFNPKVAAILDKYFAKFHDTDDEPVPVTPAPAAAPAAAP